MNEDMLPGAEPGDGEAREPESYLGCIVAGDEAAEAWDALEERYGPAVAHYFQLRFEGRRTAEEIAEKFFELMRAQAQETVPATLRPWLATLQQQFVRHLYRRPEYSLTELGKREGYGETESDDAFDRDWAQQAMLGALKRFRKGYPQIHALLLRVYDRAGGAPMPDKKQMASLLGLSAAQLESRLNEAHEALRYELSKELKHTVTTPEALGAEREFLEPFLDPMFAALRT
ncbi:MAG: hypothetical protein V3T86_14630 [Planctomycetota bacterium]